MNHPDYLESWPACVPQSIYVIGDSEIDEKTEQVLAFDCSHTLELTQRFLQDLFVGQHFPSIDSWLEETLARRYGGTSRRALVVSYRVALNRYQAMKRGEDL